MSSNTIDCSKVSAIVTAFAPESPAQRDGLDAAIRLYGQYKYQQGEMAGIHRAAEIIKNNPLPNACFRLAEILAERK